MLYWKVWLISNFYRDWETKLGGYFDSSGRVESSAAAFTVFYETRIAVAAAGGLS